MPKWGVACVWKHSVEVIGVFVRLSGRKTHKVADVFFFPLAEIDLIRPKYRNLPEILYMIYFCRHVTCSYLPFSISISAKINQTTDKQFFFSLLFLFRPTNYIGCLLFEWAFYGFYVYNSIYWAFRCSLFGFVWLSCLFDIPLPVFSAKIAILWMNSKKTHGELNVLRWFYCPCKTEMLKAC